MLIKLLLGTAIGAVIGGSIGRRINCKGGGCPLSSSPVWGGLIGGGVGLILALNLGVTSPALTEAKDSKGALLHVTSLSGLRTQLQNGTDNALVVFSAPWCPACVHYEPVVKSLSTQFASKITFIKVNVDEARELAANFRIARLPTTVLLKHGEEIKRFVGGKSASGLSNLLQGSFSF